MKNCIKEWEEELTKSIKGFDITFDKYDLIEAKIEGAKQREKEILEIIEKKHKESESRWSGDFGMIEDLIKEVKEK